ncbi:MAG: SPOR domain-containing protein [Burkholderiales bacterium]|nr:SPOR domain-containing protein [Burkholderiales bacterium]
MAESEEALQLKRRARRRLVGAIALVTFVVIILPLILDKEPGPAGPPLSVQIPNQESSGFKSGVVSPAPAMPAASAPEAKAKPAPVKAEPPAAVKAATLEANAEPAPAKEAPKSQSKAEELRARAALNDQAWVVALDAFADEANVKQMRSKLSAAGVKSYTEPVKTSKGELTRVRAGPFASKEAAEKARAKLEKMGLKPGAVVSR